MPVEYCNSNPTDGTGVYYPACHERLFAYHGINAHPDPKQNLQYVYEMHEVVATEEAFRSIWREGVLYSYAERLRRGEHGPSSMIFGMDKVAGDDEYVFLNVCKPHSAGHVGYHFVFDPYELISNGAHIGLYDLQSFYMNIAERLNVENRNDDKTWTDEQVAKFVEDAEFVKSVWRISDGEAITWLKWVQGVIKKSPVNANALRYIARVVGNIGYHNIRWVSTDRGAATRHSELLMPQKLPLSLLVGVIFRKQWIEIDDFVNYYGPPGSEPPPAISIHDAGSVAHTTGHPARCPHCRGWINLEPLRIPESSWMYGYVWQDRRQCPGIELPVRVMKCKSCGAALGHHRSSLSWDEPFDPEEYLCQYKETEYVGHRW